MSFDTVIFKKPFEPLGGDFWHDEGFTQAKNQRLIRNADLTSMTVHQKGYRGKDWLMVQASLPKILYGHNATLPDEQKAREAATWLCGYVGNSTRVCSECVTLPHAGSSTQPGPSWKAPGHTSRRRRM